MTRNPFECPVCHSTDKGIKGNKVHTNGRWWSRCHNGDSAHGDMALPDGRVVTFPDPLYFSNDGRVATDHGEFVITRQVRQ
jgi:hypothetical protein